ncbi:MAG: hypothetical protein LBI05_07585 [Planctomycetaceae bacterium]|jgi:hypothetical protein|nr:hypothetical protein [Planctomycetaceae bacterium]
MVRTSWHPAFAQAIENELEDSKDALTFETEHQLTTEPLRIDVLIIKKKRSVIIKKNIGQIFRGFNIVEYKSPGDRVTIEDYHKTHCYSRLYASLNKEDIAEMSVTVAVTRHPRKLLGFLTSRFTVKNVQPRIYTVEGDTSPTQILVSEELLGEDNFWLTNLRDDLTEEQLTRVFTVAESRAKTDAYIYTIAEANVETMEEMFMRKKEGVIISEKLDGYFRARYAPLIKAEGIAEGEAKAGREIILESLRERFGKVPKNIERAIHQMNDPIALKSLAVRTGNCITLDEFAAELLPEILLRCFRRQ